MNYELFQLINNLAGTYTWLDISMILTVKYLAGCFAALLLLLLGLGIYYKDKTLLKTSIHTIVFLGIILITHSIIGFIIQEPRPFVTHTVHLLIPHAADSSFPSTHAMAMTAIALPIFATYKRLGTILLIGTIVTGTITHLISSWGYSLPTYYLKFLKTIFLRLLINCYITLNIIFSVYLQT